MSDEARVRELESDISYRDQCALDRNVTDPPHLTPTPPSR